MQKDQSYFERLGENAKRQRLDKTGQFHRKKVGVVEASYKVSFLVAQNIKAHTIAEFLVLPAAKTLVRNLIGDEAAAKLHIVSLSNDTVKHRIQKMSGDIAEQVIAGVKDSKFGFAIQIHKSTDVAKCSQLLVYVRFIQNNTVKAELMLSQEVAATIKRKDVFNFLKDFFKENEIDWSMSAGCTTDSDPTMLGRKSGFQAYVKNVAANVTFVHCFIHRFALCTKVLPFELMSCLNKIIKIVNVIKTSASGFSAFCKTLVKISVLNVNVSFSTQKFTGFPREYDKEGI